MFEGLQKVRPCWMAGPDGHLHTGEEEIQGFVWLKNFDILMWCFFVGEPLLVRVDDDRHKNQWCFEWTDKWVLVT